MSQTETYASFVFCFFFPLPFRVLKILNVTKVKVWNNTSSSTQQRTLLLKRLVVSPVIPFWRLLGSEFMPSGEFSSLAAARLDSVGQLMCFFEY